MEAGLVHTPFQPLQVAVLSRRASRPGKVHGGLRPCSRFRETLLSPIQVWLQTPRSVVGDLSETGGGVCKNYASLACTFEQLVSQMSLIHACAACWPRLYAYADNVWPAVICSTSSTSANRFFSRQDRFVAGCQRSRRIRKQRWWFAAGSQ